MRKVLIGLALLLLVTLAVLVAIPFFIPTDAYKRQISLAVQKATGRELAIDGDVRLSILPRLELEVNDVAFANVPGSAEPNMATLEQMLVGLELMPLLDGEVRVDRFVLVEPTLHLEVDAEGRGNWEWPAVAESASGTGGPGGDAPTDRLRDLTLGDVRITGGHVTYADARTGDRYELADVNMRVSLPNLDSPFQAAGSVTWNGEAVDLEVSTARPRTLLAGEAAPVEVKVASAPVTLAYAGTVTRRAPLHVQGDIDLHMPSVRAAAAWVGQPITLGGTGLGPLSIAGTLDVTGKTVAFQNATLKLDDMNATGDVRVDTSGAKPHVHGRLDVDQLDVNLYLPSPVPAEAAPAGAAEPSPARVGAWSTEPMDVRALHALNAHLTLSAGAILFRDVKLDRSVLHVTLEDGVFTADLTELGLYGGGGTGRIVVDGRWAEPKIEERFALAGVNARGLLMGAADIEWLEGTMQLDVTTTTTGRTQRDMVQRLNGSGQVKVTDGAIYRVNLGAMARNVSSAFLDPEARTAQKTDFAEFSGSFRIENGLVYNDDLLLLNPLLRLTGAGVVDMPAQTLRYRLLPKIVATTKGQGGRVERQGLTVPVIIEGPWDDISYRPDLGGIVQEVLKDPGSVVEQGKRTLEGLAEGLLGGLGVGRLPDEEEAPARSQPEEAAPEVQPEAETEPEEAEVPPDPVEALIDLFGR